MNRIYKVIWNEAKHCHVVASELAKGHAKSNTGKNGTGRGGLSLIIAALLMGIAAFSGAGQEAGAFTIWSSIPSKYTQDWGKDKFDGLAYGEDDYGKKTLNILLANNKYISGYFSDWVTTLAGDENWVTALAGNEKFTREIIQKAPDDYKDQYTYSITSVKKAPSGESGSSSNTTEYTLKTLKNGEETGDKQTFTDTDTHANISSASLNGQKLTITDTDNHSAEVNLSGLYTAGKAINITDGAIGVKTADTNSGLDAADGLKVKAKTNGGITIDENGLSVNTAAIKSAIDTDTHANIKEATLTGQTLKVTDTDDHSAEVNLSGLYTAGSAINIADGAIGVKT
ncbi:ESPR domain-containing protein, partial [Dialister sp.]|uniref:ESPR domain-containing protein n=1 Tax=Dialister sp. TaxID=1955814 RepID=UPI002E80938F